MKTFQKSELSRRGILRGTLAMGVIAAFGAPLLTACGDGGIPAGANAGNASLPTFVKFPGVTADLPGTNAGVTDGYFTYPANPPKTTTGIPGDGKPITVMMPAAGAIPPAPDQNAYAQELNKRLGSELKVAWTPSADWSQKLATTIAGDQLPDVFNLLNETPDFPSMLEAKALDLTPYLAGDAIKKYPALANIPTESWRGAVFNGKIFGLPIPRGITTSRILYRREDILEQLGATAVPTSFAEFLELCETVTEPSKNRWALASLPMTFVQEMYQLPNNWSEHDGAFSHLFEHENMKAALEAGRQLVAAKVVNPDAFASAQAQYKKWFDAGTAVMVEDSLSAWQGFQRRGVAIPGFKMAAHPAPGADGGSGSFWLGDPNHSITAINKKSKDRVETILNVFNWLASPFGTEEDMLRQYGVEGLDYELDGSDPILTDQGTLEIKANPVYLTGSPATLYISQGEDAVRARHDAEEALVPLAVKDASNGLYSATASRTGAQQLKSMEALQNDIVQGRKPVSAWDAGVKDWQGKAGDKMRSEYEEAFAQLKNA
ncbi:extracellular solute-binding protein [Arthrobacter glacialis]|uniref:ABC transporter substrate-binding protein n=1 Tax=Arthrobacter glacialis TaxID=1664 RepID=A0A2S4A266_ARTGL|nr:extracellular solute-binding protein [Arthrobacter glacialis]POH75419.1 ABC transporter substrate-binding protein [Arthrobacter glacialis]